MAPNARAQWSIWPASLRPAKPLTMPWSGGRRGPSSEPVTLSLRRANHQSDDKAFVVPNLQVEAVLHLRRCGHNLFIVGALHYFGWPVEMTVFADCVNAILTMSPPRRLNSRHNWTPPTRFQSATVHRVQKSEAGFPVVAVTSPSCRSSFVRIRLEFSWNPNGEPALRNRNGVEL